jgi:hypothetical protein
MTKDKALKMALNALKNGKKIREGAGGTLVQPVQEQVAILAIEEALALQEPVALPDGKRLILVDGTFDDLMFWLDRCEGKGHLERCYDLVEPWANFDYAPYTLPQ